MSVSDPSERLACHVSSATLPGLTRPAPSLLPLTLQITWREFFNRQKRVIHEDGFALVLTKAEIVTNEGLASTRILCSGSGAPRGDALAQRRRWSGLAEVRRGCPCPPAARASLLLFYQQTGLWSQALGCSHGIWHEEHGVQTLQGGRVGWKWEGFCPAPELLCRSHCSVIFLILVGCVQLSISCSE